MGMSSIPSHRCSETRGLPGANITEWWHSMNRKGFSPTPAEGHDLETGSEGGRSMTHTGRDMLGKKW